MNILLDHDGTYSVDTHLWDMFIHHAIGNGHDVYMVTSRCDNDPLPYYGYLHAADIPIYYTNYMAKRQFMEDLGIKVDVFIDDNPKYIDEDYPQEVAEYWRATPHAN